jgi:hypothetical protein
VRDAVLHSRTLLGDAGWSILRNIPTQVCAQDIGPSALLASPLTAGLGWLGVAFYWCDLVNGIPGFQQNVITDPEYPGVPATHPWRVLLRPHCVIWVDKLSTAKIHLDKTILSKSFT